jgi:hypothetical protein
MDDTKFRIKEILTEDIRPLSEGLQTFNVGGTKISIGGGGGSVSVNGKTYGPTGYTGSTPRRTTAPARRTTAPSPARRPPISTRLPATTAPPIKKPRPEERRTVGKTELIYYEDVSSSMRNSLESAVADARKYMASKNLTWVMDAKLYIKSDPRNGGTYFSGDDSVWVTPRFQTYRWLVSVIIHEFSHRLHYKFNPAFDREVSEKYSYCMNYDRGVFFSEYSKKDRHEFWAVHFTAWIMDDMRGNRLGPWVANMIEKYN